MNISIKIKKEDKAVMISGIRRLILSMGYYENTIEHFCTREMLSEIGDKLMMTLRDSRVIRMNLVQAVYFIKYLEIYAQYGIYEMSNSGLLKAEIEKKIKEKYINT